MLSEALRDEIGRLRLAFCCEECRHFVADEAACDLLYPTAPHRRAAYDASQDGDPLLFCKMFEAE